MRNAVTIPENRMNNLSQDVNLTRVNGKPTIAIKRHVAMTPLFGWRHEWIHAHLPPKTST